MNDKNFSLANQVFERLEREILTEQIKRGSVINEGALSASYGVSRTPLREAVAMLESEGLVKNTGKKIVVVGFSAEDMKDIMDIRIALEGESYAKTAKNIDDGGIKELENILKLQSFYISQEDSENISRLDAEFHDTMYKYCGSRVYALILREMHRKLLHYRALSVRSHPRAEQSGEEHAEIFKAVAAHDEALARELGNKHIKNAKQRMLKFLGEEE